MIVIARIMARSFNGGLKDKHLRRVGDRSMMGRVCDTVYSCGWINRLFVWTDDPRIGAQATGAHVIHRKVEDCFYNGGYSNPNDWGTTMDTEIQTVMGGKPDVVVALNANFCLVTADVLTTMFTRLMEDESASAITAVVPVGPGLVTPNPVKPGYMYPVWLQPGLDRQNYPPLYRITGIRIQRHNRSDIHGFGLREMWHSISAVEGLDVQTEDDLKMANYFAGQAVAAGPDKITTILDECLPEELTRRVKETLFTVKVEHP